MDISKPNEPSDGAELHAEIIRRRAAELRRSHREFAIAAANHLPPARIAEMIDASLDTVMRFLAVDGKDICTECHYGLHARCLVLVDTSRDGIRHCECPACRT